MSRLDLVGCCCHSSGMTLGTAVPGRGLACFAEVHVYANITFGMPLLDLLIGTLFFCVCPVKVEVLLQRSAASFIGTLYCIKVQLWIHASQPCWLKSVFLVHRGKFLL